MSVLENVLASLQAMTQWQLLLAFVACMAYVLGQGSLLPARGRRVAWVAAALAAAGFVADGRDWTLATMLLGFAIVGLGSFVGVVWLICRALGISRPRGAAGAVEGDWPSTAPAGLTATARAPAQRGAPVASQF